MHVKVKNRIAIIEFENGKEKITHASIIEDLIKCLNLGFKTFVFDFKCVDISFNSMVSGFIITAIKKLMDIDSCVILKNIRNEDYEMLKIFGIDQFDKNKLTIIYNDDKLC